MPPTYGAAGGLLVRRGSSAPGISLLVASAGPRWAL